MMFGTLPPSSVSMPSAKAMSVAPGSPAGPARPRRPIDMDVMTAENHAADGTDRRQQDIPGFDS